MKKKILAVLFAGVMGLSLVGCGSKDPDTVAASVNGEEITLGELEFMLRMNKASVEESMGGQDLWDHEVEDGVKFKDEYKSLMMDQMINAEAISQDAKKQGIDVSETEVNMTYENLKSTVDADKELKSFMKEAGITDDFLKKQAEMEMLIQYHQNKFDEETKVSDDKLKKYYDEHEVDYHIYEIEASHILIKTTDDKNQPLPEDKKVKAKEKAESILAKARSGEDFAELAKKYSEDPGTAKNGGQLGMFGRGEMVPEFDEAAFNLNVGEISDVVETEYGYHIIKVTDIRDETTPYEEVKESVKVEVLNQLYGEKTEELQSKSKVERNEDVIKSAEF